MSKPNSPSLIVKLQGLDRKHYQATDRYAHQVQQLYDTAAKEYAALAGTLTPDPDKPFTFADYPKAKKQASKLAADLTSNIQRVIEAGQRSEWVAATYRSDALIAAVLNRSKLTADELAQYEDRNMEGLAAFQSRKVQGMNLSQRVWKHTDQFTQQMELAVDVSLGEGKSAQQLSRDVRGLLNEPNKLFRRVRDKYGNLNLSKAAAAYHPGRGVYRSSAQNAMRLARTEINMAYRTADWQRWQSLEFVVGIRIELSNNHTVKDRKGKDVELVDICNELCGDYPKTFKFVGWHPNCRCMMTPIMQTFDEMHQARRARFEATMDNKAYEALPSANRVDDVPDAFKNYIESIAERSRNWASQPYYIRDNFKGGTIEGGLASAIPHKTPIGGTAKKQDVPPTPCTDFDEMINDLKAQAYSLGLDVSKIDGLRAAGDKEALKAEVYRVYNIGGQRSKDWVEASDALKQAIMSYKGDYKSPEGIDFLNSELAKYEAILRNNRYSLSRYYRDAITNMEEATAALKAIDTSNLIKAERAWADANTPEISANVKTFETLLNTKAGIPMGHKQANQGRENPNFGKDDAFSINCQMATVTHYLRRLGLNVEAVGNYKPSTTSEGSVYVEMARQGMTWQERFLNPNGTKAGYRWSSSWSKSMTDALIEPFLDANMPSEGLYEIYVEWKNANNAQYKAHVFLAEKTASGIQYFDPQSGSENCRSSLIEAKPDKVGILRIDNKIVNPKLKNLFIVKVD